MSAVLFGLFSKRAPAIAPKIVLPIHVVLYGLSKVIPVFGRVHYLYVVFGLFCLECVIYWLCIRYAPRSEDWEMPDANVIDMTPWKTGKAWAVAGALFVVVIFWICSPLGIAK